MLCSRQILEKIFEYSGIVMTYFQAATEPRSQEKCWINDIEFIGHLRNFIEKVLKKLTAAKLVRKSQFFYRTSSLFLMYIWVINEIS
jgi:hypothetical protein